MLMIDGYRLRMYAHCGMSYDIATTGDSPAELDALRTRAMQFIRAREERGYMITTLAPKPDERDRWELTEPEDAAMVPDDAGILCVEPIPAKTVSCHECGFPVCVGDTCDCSESIEN